MHTATETTSNNQASWRYDKVLWMILGIALVLGVIYNFAIVPGLGPDEHRHFNYVKLLFVEHRLPFLLPDGSEYHGAHSFHPPLYYIYLLPFYIVGKLLPGDAVWHVMRLGSLLLCLLALPLIYQLALAAGGKRVAWIATILVGWLPMWGMTAGTINNDSANFLAVVILLWLLAIVFPNDRSYRSAAIIGIALGLGTLCKATALLCGVAAILLYLWLQYGKDGWKSSHLWGRLGTMLGVTILIAGWWHVRSLLMYGTFTPLPPSMPTPFLPDPKNGMLILIMHPHFPEIFGYANLKIFETIWAQKDWLFMSSPPVAWHALIRNGIYGIFALLAFAGAVGFFVQKLRLQHHRETIQTSLSTQLAKVLSGAVFIISWLAVLQVALFWHWGWAEGGRYLLAGLCGFTIWNARGLSFLTGKKTVILFAIIGLFLLAINVISIYWLLHYLNPTYSP